VSQFKTMSMGLDGWGEWLMAYSDTRTEECPYHGTILRTMLLGEKNCEVVIYL